MPEAPSGLAPEKLAEALAILCVDLVCALRLNNRQAVLEGLANVLDRRGRTPGGSEAAQMLGAISASMLKLGC